MKWKRIIIPAACCLAGVVAGACGMHLLRPPRPRPERVVVLAPPGVVRPQLAFEPAAIVDAAAATLRRPVGEFRADGDRLDDVIDHLRSRSGVPIFVNWKALATAGVTHDLPITFRTPGPALSDALDQLLTELGGNGGGPRLGYEVEDEEDQFGKSQSVVTISTADDVLKKVVTRVYDIRHLIRGTDNRREAIAAVIRRVEGIDPLSWRDHGGSLGRCQELSGQLVVTQTVTVHRRIVDLLDDGPSRARAPAPALGTAKPNPPTTAPVLSPPPTEDDGLSAIRDVTRMH